MTNPNRPLSPFLMYRPQITSVLSILHRITGVVLSVGILVLVYWLVAAASGPAQSAIVQFVEQVRNEHALARTPRCLHGPFRDPR